jgi:3-dehydroquinate dehydratase II
MMKIEIINGPNLNLLGQREPEKYGYFSFKDFLPVLKSRYPDIIFEYFQSNIEGEIINEIQKSGFSIDGIILNAGGYTHTSVAITDAIAAINTLVLEVHITNLYAREEFRHTSLIGKNCVGSISGFGLDSYRLAVEALIEINNSKKK